MFFGIRLDNCRSYTIFDTTVNDPDFARNYINSETEFSTLHSASTTL
jgi:hypothetical protein